MLGWRGHNATVQLHDRYSLAAYAYTHTHSLRRAAMNEQKADSWCSGSLAWRRNLSRVHDQ
jgi:hypothetical protein